MNSANVLQSMDLALMLGSPFTAAQQAQAKMTSTTIEFLQAFAFERDSSGNNTNEIRTFSMNTYFDDPDSSGNKITQKQRQLTMPLIALLNVPALQIQKITVDLTVKVSSQVAASSTSANSLSVGASAGGSVGFNGFFASGSASFSVSTEVSSSNSNTNSFDASSSAKYDVHIEAENKPPAGLAMLLDFCTKPDIAPNRAKYPDGRTL
jgi:hypothetical protein